MHPLLPNVHGELIQNKPSNIDIYMINVSGEAVTLKKGEKFILSYYTDDESTGKVSKPDALAKSKLDFTMEIEAEGLVNKKVETSLLRQERKEEVTSSIGVESESYTIQNDFVLDENKNIHISIKNLNTGISPRTGNFYLTRKKGLKTFFRIPIQVRVKSEDVQINGKLTIKGAVEAEDKLTVKGIVKSEDKIHSNHLSITGNFNSEKDLTVSSDTTLMPIGTILLWNGTKSNVPNGWAICDGSDSRAPNLAGRFVMGRSNDSHKWGGNSGNKVTLSIDNMPSHNHGGSTQSTDIIKNSYYKRYFVFWYSDDYSTSTFHSGAGSFGTEYRTAVHGMNYNNNSILQEITKSHSHNISSQGSGTSFDITPEYTALYYIMRVK